MITIATTKKPGNVKALATTKKKKNKSGELVTRQNAIEKHDTATVNLRHPSADGSNTFYAKFIMEVLNISRNADANDPEALWDCFCQYLQLCAECDMKVATLTAYASMNISKQTAHNWRSGKERFNDPRYRQLIQNVDKICSISRETLIQDGKISPVIGIWWQKNFDGFSDTPVEIAADTSGNELISCEDLAKKYADYEE